MSKNDDRHPQAPGYAVKTFEIPAVGSAKPHRMEMEGVGCLLIPEGDPKDLRIRFNQPNYDPVPVRGMLPWGIPFEEIYVEHGPAINARLHVISQLDGEFNLGPYDVFKDWQYEGVINLSTVGVTRTFQEMNADRVTVQLINVGGGANNLNYEIRSTIEDNSAGIYTKDFTGAIPGALPAGVSETFLINHAVRYLQIELTPVAGPWAVSMMAWAHKRR